MILVTGATGTVGRSLVHQLVAAQVPVRALTRRPAAAKLPDVVDVVAGDLSKPADIAAALRGVDRVFLLSTGPDIPTHDANLIREAARAGVAHVVKLSSGRTGDDTATDPIPSWHRLGEQALRDSGIGWTILGPLGFMANALHWAGSIRSQDSVFAPYGHGRIAVIDEDDIASVAATVLTTDGHDGRTYRLSGPEALTPREMTGILGDLLGRPLRFVEVEPAVARQAILDHGQTEVMTDAIMALRATALESFTSAVHPTVSEVTGRRPNSFREWATRHIADFT
ncbi:NAD(P)H-binding protein [Nocardia iowensis]|uniref:NAD(P)H-binding protein n=1 Tax=Nocardia iowensis TaxID=204891 RepID=A0ABX8RG14_NOCIO|nr:NAD(P)H-binding protein [Nocardia iowensis]QXN88540.1 NAD(P)H-binding protein [Nocardia iowensis]